MRLRNLAPIMQHQKHSQAQLLNSLHSMITKGILQWKVSSSMTGRDMGSTGLIRTGNALVVIPSGRDDSSLDRHIACWTGIQSRRMCNY